jgi:hypothetical protein
MPSQARAVKAFTIDRRRSSAVLADTRPNGVMQLQCFITSRDETWLVLVQSLYLEGRSAVSVP